MASIATRTAVSGITGSNLAQLDVPLPPLPTQHRTASILSTYDDLIENNTRRIKILEQSWRRRSSASGLWSFAFQVINV